MNNALLVSLLYVAGLFAHAPAMGETLAYPEAENPSFPIEAPSDWKGEPPKESGDYLNLEGPMRCGHAVAHDARQ